VRVLRWPLAHVCHRLAGSKLGPAHRPLRDNGEVQTFETLADARAEAERLNKRVRSPNVRYTAHEGPPPQEGVS
jgi:hypothetical protein